MCLACLKSVANTKLVQLCRRAAGDNAALPAAAAEGVNANPQNPANPPNANRNEAAATPSACQQCFCLRPMWCVECIARWFVARLTAQQQPPHTWLSQRATCPTCRAPFCILDVCRVLDPRAARPGSTSASARSDRPDRPGRRTDADRDRRDRELDLD